MTVTDCRSWWVGTTDAEFTKRARAEQPRMQAGKAIYYASHYDATAPKVRDGWRNPLPVVENES